MRLDCTVSKLNWPIVRQSVTEEASVDHKIKVYLPIQEPNGNSTPVCRNKAMDSDLPIPRSAFLTFSVLPNVKRTLADLVIG